MEVRGAKINQFLVEVFDQILRREEDCLTARYPRLSLKEIHLIDAVCRAADHGGDNRATAIAAAQGVTAGTLTSSVNLLERKTRPARKKKPQPLVPAVSCFSETIVLSALRSDPT